MSNVVIDSSGGSAIVKNVFVLLLYRGGGNSFCMQDRATRHEISEPTLVLCEPRVPEEGVEGLTQKRTESPFFKLRSILRHNSLTTRKFINSPSILLCTRANCHSLMLRGGEGRSNLVDKSGNRIHQWCVKTRLSPMSNLLRKCALCLQAAFED